MRYYQISITNPTTGAAILPSSLGGYAISSLLPNGRTNPAALLVEFDLPMANFFDPDNNAFVRIWGLGLGAIGNAFNLNDANISVSLGMSSGLPLANPAQRGLVVSGTIFQAYGNWLGTDQTVDINILAGGHKPTNGNAFVFQWTAGTPLNVAIAQMLNTAVPTAKQVINISPNLVINSTETGYYTSLQQFASYINARTQPILGGTYPGVRMTGDGNTITVWDNTAPAAPAITINFQDLLGQPTWIDAATIEVKLVLRGDLRLGSLITLPQSLATQTLGSLLRLQDKTTFTGTYFITQIHHYGNSRQADAMSWNTTINATPYSP